MKSKNSHELLTILTQGDWNSKLEASNELIAVATPTITQSIIELLQSPVSEIRDIAALTLREIKDDRAVQPLLNSIKDPNHFGVRSTLAYALETLNCSEYFIDIFQLALAKHVFVRTSAMTILTEQRFWIEDSDIVHARQLLADSLDVSIDRKTLHDYLNWISQGDE